MEESNPAEFIGPSLEKSFAKNSSYNWRIIHPFDNDSTLGVEVMPWKGLIPRWRFVLPSEYNGLIKWGIIVPGTYNVDENLIEDAVNKKTKGIILAHTLGNTFNVDKVLEICKKNNLWLIEDNCDALGTKYKGRFTGTFGDVSTLSFYPAHHITMGEGGAVFTNNFRIKRIATGSSN